MTSRPQKNHVREIRLSRGLTLQEVASQIGTTPTQVSRLEKGLRKLTPEWIEKLSEALGVSDRELIKGVKEEFINSKLIPKSFEDTYDVLDREFLIICFEVVHDWWDFARRKRIFGPRQALVNATILYPMFYELFKKIGPSAELLIAMKQAGAQIFSGIVTQEMERAATGAIPFYDRLADFFSAQADPDEADDDSREGDTETEHE